MSGLRCTLEMKVCQVKTQLTSVLVRPFGGSEMHHGILVSPRGHHGNKSGDSCLSAASVSQKAS